MSRTIIRYAEGGTPRWGVQFGRRIAPEAFPVDEDAEAAGEVNDQTPDSD